MSLGYNLRIARERLGFTPQQAAKAAGIPLADYRAFESDTGKPTVDEVRNLSQSLFVSADELIGDTWHPAHFSSAFEHFSLAVVDFARHLTDDQQDDLIAQIRSSAAPR